MIPFPQCFPTTGFPLFIHNIISYESISLSICTLPDHMLNMPITYLKRKRPEEREEDEEDEEDDSQPSLSSTLYTTRNPSHHRKIPTGRGRTENEDEEIRMSREERRRLRKEEEYEDTVGCLKGQYKGEKGESQSSFSNESPESMISYPCNALAV